MQALDLLTSLPSTLSCIVLQKWLSLKSVMALDSAYCSQSHRKDFLELLNSDEYLICEQVVFAADKGPFSMLQRLGEKLRHAKLTSRLLHAQETLVTSHCHNLERISFESTVITKKLWSLLNRKTDRLSLSNVASVNYKLLQVPHLCPFLTSLGVSNSAINETTLKTIATSCPHIVHLDISYNIGISDTGVLCTVQNLTQLQSLNIEGNTDLTNLSLAHISTHCANTLHTLFLYCGEVDDEGVARCAPAFGEESINELLERCTQLRTLYLGRFFRDAYVDNVVHIPAAVIRNLTTLVLGSTFVFNENMVRIGKYGTNLRVLAIDDTDYLFPHQALMGLVDGCVNLKELYINLETRSDAVSDSILGFALTCMDLWMRIRPGLVIQHVSSDWEYNKHDVMNI